jgi:hypothetical protein
MLLDNGNAISDESEFISWSESSRQFYRQEKCAKYPKADMVLVEVFEEMLSSAKQYFVQTGKHLQIYGALGELYGAIHYGISLHKNFAKGSDGRVGNNFVEIKTIGPLSVSEETTFKWARHFNQVVIVRICKDFIISSVLIARKSLPSRGTNKICLNWQEAQNIVSQVA